MPSQSPAQGHYPSPQHPNPQGPPQHQSPYIQQIQGPPPPQQQQEVPYYSQHHQSPYSTNSAPSNYSSSGMFCFCVHKSPRVRPCAQRINDASTWMPPSYIPPAQNGILTIRRNPRAHGGRNNEQGRLSSDLISHPAVKLTSICSVSTARPARPANLWTTAQPDASINVLHTLCFGASSPTVTLPAAPFKRATATNGDAIAAHVPPAKPADAASATTTTTSAASSPNSWNDGKPQVAHVADATSTATVRTRPASSSASRPSRRHPQHARWPSRRTQRQP